MVYSVLFGFLGWYYVPHFVTRHALGFIHQFSANYLGIAPPQPGTPAFRNNYRYTYAAVVLGYLLYNLVESSRTLPANFYEILAVPPDVDEAGLRVAFRQFAKKNHPDRVGADGAALFIQVRDVYDALKNPTVRFAYDRFGPDVLSWSGLSTPGEYLHTGLIRSSGFHLVAGVVLLLWSSIGRASVVKFWRYILYLTFFASELSLLVHPSPSSSSSIFVSGSILHSLFPGRVAFQHVLFLHQLFMFLTTALTNVAPVLFSGDPSETQDGMLQRLNALAGVADREASMLLHTELHSIQPSSEETRVSTSRLRPCSEPPPDVMDRLAAEMQNMMIERQLMQEVGPLRSAWEGAIKEGRRRTHLHPDDAFGQELDASVTLPSPVSPVGSPSKDSVVDGATRLPSPRPSPPPPLHRKNSSYVRARSVSY